MGESLERQAKLGRSGGLAEGMPKRRDEPPGECPTRSRSANSRQRVLRGLG